MKHKGLTLIELVVAMVVTTIIALSMVLYFVGENSFRNMMQERVTLAREARIATNHMTRVLRFAIPDTIDDTIDNQISATIAVGDSSNPHLGSITSDTYVEYILNDDNTLMYTQGIDGTPIEIAEDIIYFDSTFDNPELTIQLIAEKTIKGTVKSIPIETTIRVLGE